MNDGQPKQSYSGRLELTWTNKDQRLLAHEDGSYEWLPPSDYRVAEVRLLDNAGTIGKTRADRSRAKDNLLIRGDALNALTSLCELPQFAKELVGQVKLAYLDPPFNTQQSFLHYDDALEHSVWLTMMRDRLLQIKQLLSPSGSVWVHCDDSEQARLKVLMDEIFGTDAFVATFIWQKVDSPSENVSAIVTDHDYIICYSRMPGQVDFSQRPDPSVLDAYLRDKKTGKLYRDRLLRKNGKDSLRSDRPKMWFPIADPDGQDVWPIDDDGIERRWGRSKLTVEAMRKNDELIWKRRQKSDAGEHWVPYVREYPKEEPTKPWPTIWIDVLTSRQSKAHLKQLLPGTPVFSTPKPEPLLQRIIEIGSEPGDIILDCFLGSGTTAAVAHKLNRRWLGVEWASETLDASVIPRLSKVVAGDDSGGVTGSAKWAGGGGFRILDVAPSMFVADGGVVVLADWAVNGKLAEATSAQLGFEFESDPPFSGRKGRTRLTVIDGLISTDVVQLIAGALGEDERVVVCGTAIDPLAGKVLREARAGSSVRKIPASILEEYRHARWTPKAIASTGPDGGDTADAGIEVSVDVETATP